MPSWLEQFIGDAARSVEPSARSGPAFASVIEGRLRAVPLTVWELERWARGLRHGLLKLSGHWFRLGSGRQSSFNLFVRNEEGELVGLHREALTQAAAYVALITDYGYPRSLVRFEIDYLDVAVRDRRGNVLAYAETKASTRTLERLLARLVSNFEGGLPDLPEEGGSPARSPDDARHKAEHILDNRPAYFWGVSPDVRRAFRVRFTHFGFGLDPLEDFPRKEHLRAEPGRL